MKTWKENSRLHFRATEAPARRGSAACWRTAACPAGGVVVGGDNDGTSDPASRCPASRRRLPDTSRPTRRVPSGRPRIRPYDRGRDVATGGAQAHGEPAGRLSSRLQQRRALTWTVPTACLARDHRRDRPRARWGLLEICRRHAGFACGRQIHGGGGSVLRLQQPAADRRHSKPLRALSTSPTVDPHRGPTPKVLGGDPTAADAGGRAGFDAAKAVDAGNSPSSYREKPQPER